MRGYQSILQVMTSPTYATGGAFSLACNTLPSTMFGRICHLRGFLFDVLVTPTFSSGTSTQAAINSVVKSLVFHDGLTERFNGGFHDLRNHVLAETGNLLFPDADLPATTETARIRHFLPIGPLNMYDGDFMIPTACLNNAELRFGFGGLTDYLANCSAITCTIKVYAALCLRDNELLIPPLFERRSLNFGSSTIPVQGDALYNSLFLTKQDYTAWANGDLGDITIDTGRGSLASVTASALTAWTNYLSSVGGHLSPLQGEPGTTTYDDNAKIVNGTALAAALANHQPVIVPARNGKISKLVYGSDSSLQVRWSGTASSTRYSYSRFLRQPKTQYGQYAALAAAKLNVQPKTGKTKTLSKAPYTGPMAEFMPAQFDLT